MGEWVSIFDNTKWAGVAGDAGQSAAIWNTDHWTVYYGPYTALKDNAYLSELNDSLLTLRPAKIRLTFTGAYSWLGVIVKSDDGNTIYSGDVDSLEEVALNYADNYSDINRIEFTGDAFSLYQHSWNITNIEFYDGGDRQDSVVITTETDNGITWFVDDGVPDDGFRSPSAGGGYLGYYDYYREEIFIKFSDIPFDADYRLTSAKIKFTKQWTYTDTPLTIRYSVKARSSVSPSAPTSLSEYNTMVSSGLLSTGSNFTHDLDGTWIANDEFNVDVTDALAALVAIPGWTEDESDALFFFLENGSDRPAAGENGSGAITLCASGVPEAELPKLILDYNIYATAGLVSYDSVKNVNLFRIYIDDGEDDDLILKPSQLNLSKTYSYKYYIPGIFGEWFDMNWTLNATLPDVSNYDEIVARIDDSYQVRVEWVKQIVAGVESTEDMFDIPFENSVTGSINTRLLTIKAKPVINYNLQGNTISLQCSYSWQVTIGAISELDAVEITETPMLIKKSPSFEYNSDQYELSWPHPISGCHDARRQITYGDIDFYASDWNFSAGNKSMRTTFRERKTILVYDLDLM